MGGILSELGKKLADKWLSLLVLPGALFLAVAMAGYSLGHADALDLRRLADHVSHWARAPVNSTVGGQVILLAAGLGGAAAVGLAAQAVGSIIERITLAADWRGWPPVVRHLADRGTRRRQQRWGRAVQQWEKARRDAARAHGQQEEARVADLEAARAEAEAAMTRISLERPSRPTWIGDRIQAATVRTERDLDLDFAVVWPYLWLSMPESTRREVTTARAAITRGATLAAWAVLYLPLTWWWWPASLITATVAATSRDHLRSAAEAYATILEAATRHHLRDLASHLGFGVDGEVKRSTGDALTRHLLPSAPSEPLT